MTWEVGAAIAEIVGAIGVIVSLLYVASQVKQNTRALRMGAEQDAITSLRDFQQSLLVGDRLQIFRRGAEDFEALEEDDRACFVVLVHEMLRAFESMYLLRVRGNLRGTIWEGFERSLTDYATAPGVQHYWGLRRDVFSSAFCDLIDGLTPRTRGVRFPTLVASAGESPTIDSEADTGA